MATDSSGLGPGDEGQTNDKYSRPSRQMFGAEEDESLESGRPYPPLWTTPPSPYDGGYQVAYAPHYKRDRSLQKCQSCRRRKRECNGRPGCGYNEREPLVDLYAVSDNQKAFSPYTVHDAQSWIGKCYTYPAFHLPHAQYPLECLSAKALLLDSTTPKPSYVLDLEPSRDFPQIYGCDEDDDGDDGHTGSASPIPGHKSSSMASDSKLRPKCSPDVFQKLDVSDAFYGFNTTPTRTLLPRSLVSETRRLEDLRRALDTKGILDAVRKSGGKDIGTAAPDKDKTRLLSYVPDLSMGSSVDEVERTLNSQPNAPPPRRGRGQRKNKTYWNSKRFEPDLNLFERECFFDDEEGALKVPAVAQLDSWGDTSFCISMRYLKTLGRVHEMSTQFRNPSTDSHEGRSMRFQGVVRNLPFRIRGTSITFRKDFYVSDTLDDLVDVVFGRRFMASEFKLLFEKAGSWFAAAKETISDYSSPLMSPMAEMASNLPRKIVNFASEAGRQTIEYFSSGSSTPSPPYSLEDVCDLAAKLDPFSRHEPLEAAQSLSAPL